MAEDLYRLQQTYLPPPPQPLSVHNTNQLYSLQQTLLEEENRRRYYHLQLQQLHDNVPHTKKQECLINWQQTQVDTMTESIKKQKQQQQMQPRLVSEKENHNQPSRTLPPPPLSTNYDNLQQTLLEKENHNKSINLLKHNIKNKRKKRKCTHDGCNSNAVLAGGVCKKHGNKKYVYTCKLDGCTSQSKRGGLCGRHIRLREKEERKKESSSIEEKVAQCTHEGCMNNQMENGLCIMHGIKLKKSKKRKANPLSKQDDGRVVLCPIIINS